MTADKTREEELKKRAYQTLNQKDYGEWCFAEGRRLQKIEDNHKNMLGTDETLNKSLTEQGGLTPPLGVYQQGYAKALAIFL